MKKYTASMLSFCCCLFFNSCNTATPEDYFGHAVLASNMFSGFAADGLEREFESPSAKMDADGNAVAMKRAEALSTKIEFIEEDYEKLKDLKETADAKDILQSGKSLYELVLAVYKTEYIQLAALYDKGAAKEEIVLKTKAIHDKYFSRYETLYNTLISHGKIYATKHNIKVNWAVN